MGAGGVIIIRKNIKAALTVGVTPSGKCKIWHVVAVTHALAFIVGALVF